MSDLLKQHRKAYHKIRLNRESPSDLQWWSIFSTSWNGVSYLSAQTTGEFSTDASGTWGCGAHYKDSWFQLQWEANTFYLPIVLKELLPIVVATVVFREPAKSQPQYPPRSWKFYWTCQWTGHYQAGLSASGLFSQLPPPSTHRSYDCALRRFNSFCVEYSILDPFPNATKLNNDDLAPQTIKVYLSAVQSMQLSLGLLCPRRMPITVTVLRQIQTEINRSSEGEPDQPSVLGYCYRCILQFFSAWARCWLARRPSTRRPATFRGETVAVDCNSAASLVKIHLRKSKCNQFGAGADILLGRTGCVLCPVAAILAYISQRGRSPGHFFLDGEGKTITKPRFITQLRGYLKSAGLPSDQFAGHSFRIGAATIAAQVGMEDSIIQTLGRWHSAAFLQYIHTPHDRLAALSVSLAK
eukprot:Em0001g1141a